MGKAILWIDNSEKMMQEIVSTMFANFFDKDIKPLIFVIDNDDEVKSERNESKINELNQIIYDMFASYIVDKHILTVEEIKKKERLVKNSEDDLAVADVASFKKYYEEYKTEIEQLKSISKSERLDEEVLKNFEDLAKRMIFDSGIDTTKDDLYIAIDLCLMKNDYDNLREERPYPILSMALYKLFKDTLFERVFLYSSVAAPAKIVDSWINIYRKTIGSDSEIIVIYNRKGEPIQMKNHPDSINMTEKISNQNNETE